MKQVCILLSTYNGEAYLAEQLDSILRQSYPAFCLWVRDDGSSDGTRALLEQYAAQHKAMQLFFGENLGAAKSYFWLLANADERADYFALCDQDDVWHIDKLQRAVERLQQEDDTQPLLYFSRFEIVDANLRPLALSPRAVRIGFANALVQNQATGCTMVLNRAARTLLLSALPVRTIMHDWWIYLVLSAFGKLLYDETPTLKYRQHARNTIGATATTWDKLHRHWQSFIRGNSRIFRLTEQATEFERCFGTALAEKERRILARFLRSKQRLTSRLAYLFTGDVRRASWLDNMILKTVIALNRY
ncbi:MAG: glycosyltransferase family 2 protein [Chloroherpetonaceae bacterium]|nr:glycosyltransferase family 2 protein [Chloroherpetonaceae bacterium]MCS7210853.1 glycosyltransferase family 2 protein [Chloroherpetonaceae bacterium]MDW8018460.1 glycosyltransferase family 2 protein [Chloroherpetonaceae bacterium]